MVQHARRGDDDVDHVMAAGRGLDVPTTVDELAADDTFTEAGVLGETVVGRDPFEVGPDLVARREAVTPFGVGRERVAVEMGRHVAREPGVGVLAPRAAEAIRLLVDGEVGEPGFLQLDAAQDAGHARADDREPQLARFVIGVRSGAEPSEPRRYAIPSRSPTTSARTRDNLIGPGA